MKILKVESTHNLIINEIIQESNDPIMISHRNPIILNSHRTISDNTIRAIAESGGIFCLQFHRTNLTQIVAMIVHIKELVGIEYVGLGIGFFDLNEPSASWAMNNINEIDRLATMLYENDFTIRELKQIYGENLISYYYCV